MRSKITNQSGFTLIELLIVVAIIGLLAGIGFSQFTQLKERAYDLDAQTSLQHLFRACKVYWGDNGPSSTCNVSAVSAAPYSFASSTNITIAGTGTESSFSATANHSFSTNTLTINAAGAFS